MYIVQSRSLCALYCNFPLNYVLYFMYLNISVYHYFTSRTFFDTLCTEFIELETAFLLQSRFTSFIFSDFYFANYYWMIVFFCDIYQFFFSLNNNYIFCKFSVINHFMVFADNFANYSLSFEEPLFIKRNKRQIKINEHWLHSFLNKHLICHEN